MVRVLKVIGVSLAGAALGGGVFALVRPLLGTPYHLRRSATPRARVARTELPGPDPVGVLAAALHRRYSEPHDVDRGADGVPRPMSRLHLAPTMERNSLVWDGPHAGDGDPRGSGFDPRLVRKIGEAYELRAEDGSWLPFDDARPQMRAETPSERAAIARLLKERREIAVYTYGGFDAAGVPARPSGPAYLRQLGPAAPETDALLPAAEAAWRGGKPELPGYLLRAEPIFAGRSCVNCHSDLGETKRRYSPGDRLGLLLIAEQLPNP